MKGNEEKKSGTTTGTKQENTGEKQPAKPVAPSPSKDEKPAKTPVSPTSSGEEAGKTAPETPPAPPSRAEAKIQPAEPTLVPPKAPLPPATATPPPAPKEEGETPTTQPVEAVPTPPAPEVAPAIDNDADEDPPKSAFSGLQNYTPSALLKPGQFEAKIWNNLYSQTSFWDEDGEAQPQGARVNYFATIGNFLVGVHPRLNIGFDAWFRAVSIEDESTSPFRVLRFRNDGPTARTALSMLGPKLKFVPFPNKLERLSVQSSWLIPVLKDPTGAITNRPFLERNNFTWWTQVFFDRQIGNKSQIFAEVDLIWYLDRKFDLSEGGGVATPLSLFYSYFPTRKTTIYGSGQFWPTWGGSPFQNYFFQSSLGGKYQITKSFDIEVSYSRFLFGRATAGPAQTFNFGFRFVKF